MKTSFPSELLRTFKRYGMALFLVVPISMVIFAIWGEKPSMWFTVIGAGIYAIWRVIDDYRKGRI